MADELKSLENEHAYLLRASGYQYVKLKVFLIGSTCDKPAQSIVQNTPEPIAKYGCGQCEIPGKIFFSGEIEIVFLSFVFMV